MRYWYNSYVQTHTGEGKKDIYCLRIGALRQTDIMSSILNAQRNSDRAYISKGNQ